MSSALVATAIGGLRMMREALGFVEFVLVARAFMRADGEKELK